MTRVVVNHLRLAAPLTESVIGAAGEVCEQILAAGALSVGVVQVDDGHAILVLSFPDKDTEERVSADIGGPWMREHLLPLLSGPPERSSGMLVAGTS